MITVLTGAIKNVGDYLIGHRGRKLLKEFVDKDIVDINRFTKLDASLDIINQSRALILCGGPAYTDRIYPKVYPLVDDLSKIEVPIIPFGLGWSGTPFGHPEKFHFSSKAEKFVKSIHDNIEFSSCRDDLTLSVLHNHNIDNVIMTGCPVWYDLDSIGKEFTLPTKIRKIVFTTPANRRLLFQTNRVVKHLRRTLPDAEIIVSFHRGIRPDQYTNLKNGAAYMAMAAYSKFQGAVVEDVSYDLSKIRFYDCCDLHIGYRVHAHLYFLSKRKPSILINEDGRGLGMVRSMSLPELNKNDPVLIANLEATIQNYLETGFSDFEKVRDYLDIKFYDMKRFLSSIS